MFTVWSGSWAVDASVGGSLAAARRGPGGDWNRGFRACFRVGGASEWDAAHRGWGSFDPFVPMAEAGERGPAGKLTNRQWLWRSQRMNRIPTQSTKIQKAIAASLTHLPTALVQFDDVAVYDNSGAKPELLLVCRGGQISFFRPDAPDWVRNAAKGWVSLMRLVIIGEAAVRLF